MIGLGTAVQSITNTISTGH